MIKFIKNLNLNKDKYWILLREALVIRSIYPDAGDLYLEVTQKS